MERDLRRQFFLQKGESLDDRPITPSDVDEEVVIIECLELDLHVGRLHNLVDLTILLPTDEFAMLVGQLDLEADLMMKGLRLQSDDMVIESKENQHGP